jgi:pseudaminic acid synthase
LLIAGKQRNIYMKSEEGIITINNRRIGAGNPVFIVAELSANHNRDYRIAEMSLKAMKKAGADAVKLQTYTPDTLTIDCDKSYFQIKKGTPWAGKTLYQLYQQAYMPWSWQPKLKEVAKKIGLHFFSTPFDNSSVDFLERMNVPAYKIASFEVTDIPLIEYAASKGKPLLISTGIATEEEVEEGLNACYRKGNRNIALLKCVSLYPAPLEEMNLKTIPYLAKKFRTVVGLSDHTLELSVPVVAVTLGASIIEKHFILDRKLGGPDAAFSLEPAEFETMVNEVRKAETALGSINLMVSKNVQKSRSFARSLFVVKDMSKGERFSADTVRSIRPGYGLKPKYLKQILGKKAKKNIARGTPLSLKLITE